MDPVVKIGLKYCGGCNPYIERKELVQQVEENLKGQGIQFVGYDQDDLDLLFTISGCVVGCVSHFQEERDLLRISVAGKMFNYKNHEWQELIAEITKGIQETISQ